MINILEPFSFAFMLRALIAGVMVALLSSQLGLLVISRKMAFLGDTLSHAAFTGIALGLVLGIEPTITVFIISIIIAFLLTWLQEKSHLSSDTYIALLYSSLLALGIVIVSKSAGFRTELFQYLFGDILAIQNADLLLIAGVMVISIIISIFTYKSLLMITIDRELAHTKGVATKFYNYLFVLLLALTTAITIKIIGVLLLSALLIIPAATALTVARSLKASMALSFIFAELMTILGLYSSYSFDLPSGPTIILCGTSCFIIVSLFKRIRS